MILIGTVACLITLVTMIIAFTWKPRAGKMLICMSLLLAFIGSSMGVVLTLLMASGVGVGRTISPQFINIYSYFSGILHITSVTLLLCFIIIARDNYASENHHGDS